MPSVFWTHRLRREARDCVRVVVVVVGWVVLLGVRVAHAMAGEGRRHRGRGRHAAVGTVRVAPVLKGEERRHWRVVWRKAYSTTAHVGLVA